MTVRAAALATLGLLAAALGLWTWTDTSAVPAPPAPPPPVPPAAAPAAADEARHRARARALAEARLDRADRESRAAVAPSLEPVERLFREAGAGARRFADDALGWGSKWRLVAGWLPGTDPGRHAAYLRERFHEHVFTPEAVEAAHRQAVADYVGRLRDAENRMLVDLRADLAGLPPVLPAAALSAGELQTAFTRLLARQEDRVAADLGADAGTAVASLVLGDLAAAVAVRLGTSAGLLGAGAAGGWETFGLSLVVGLVVDQIVSWVWDWWADPRGDLARDLDARLDRLRRDLLEGDAHAPGLRGRLEALARQRDVVRRQAIVELLQPGRDDP